MIDADYTLQEIIRMTNRIYFAINRPNLEPDKIETLYKSVVQELGRLKKAAVYACEREEESNG